MENDKVVCPICETLVNATIEFCPVCNFPIKKWLEKQKEKKIEK